MLNLPIFTRAPFHVCKYLSFLEFLGYVHPKQVSCTEELLIEIDDKAVPTMLCFASQKVWLCEPLIGVELSSAYCKCLTCKSCMSMELISIELFLKKADMNRILWAMKTCTQKGYSSTRQLTYLFIESNIKNLWCIGVAKQLETITVCNRTVTVHMEAQDFCGFP